MSIARGFENALALLPGAVEQHIQTQAKQKLHSSLQAYLDALTVRMQDYLLIMEIDDENWLAEAVETGVDSWSMKQSHLKSPKTKISKEGYRYLRIPIGKEKSGQGGHTEKSRALQKKINEVMKRPTVGARKLYTVMGGRFQPGVIANSGPIVETQRIVTADPALKGLYRTRAFSDASTFHTKQTTKTGMPTWKLVMFRTMSEKPGTSPWVHPGIEGKRLLRSAKYFWAGILDEFIMGHVKTELDKLKGSGGLRGV
jgi:hypothetical protein